MKEIIYNYDYLCKEDINDTSIRMKALIINNNNILIGNASNVYQFPGGHLEENESFNDCLKREILEETGIEIEDDEIERPFMKVTFMNKDYPEHGINRESQIYYYVIKTNKNPDLLKTNYTENEKVKKYKIESFALDEVIDKIKENIHSAKENEIISRDMIDALEEYFVQRNN